MNKIFFMICFLTISNIAKSQTKALTDNGKEVLLFDNGTWTYLQDSSSVNSTSIDSLTLNKNKFTKTSQATFLVKSTSFNVGVFINPSKWAFASHKDNEKTPEYRFSLKSGEGYALMITEKTQVDLENMRQIALLNAQKASFDVKETSAEYRIVNNKKMLCLKFQGTVKGIKLAYFGYYYSNPNGTVQLLGFSSQQYFDSIQKELENFLNGLVEI
ncbi:hypothetical protein [Flavobacterium sp. M31R6]|uniref:hypothetical protein n=1 Tax=Flavobacterium sp. M31R6 TaxID=2739062 RepID=UPI0015686819|nr:hypothetical protein [Flavobacterium sp. M31R6]QKJ64892.1 hypothetical protein HQN62_17735 [Flavobacterium sp. M31R6]